MTNLLAVLPDFDVAPYTHVIAPLERASVSTADLLTLDAFDVAKRAQVPPGEVKKLTNALLQDLHATLEFGRNPRKDLKVQTNGTETNASDEDTSKPSTHISTLDDDLDAVLSGGIALGHLTEIVGESAAGKTQVLLTLLLSAQVLRQAHGGSQQEEPSALYVSTEGPLQTARLTQILKTHPKLSSLPASQRPSLARVQSTRVHDVESQEHILRYQLPVAIQKHNVRLVVIDSIAANYRAEFDKGDKQRRSAEVLAKRSSQISEIGLLLRGIARSYNVAVVVANQVADRFAPMEQASQRDSQSTQGTRVDSPHHPSRTRSTQLSNPSSQTLRISDDPLALDYQQRFFTGWGDDADITNLKTPSLGLTWTNQLSTRLALLKAPVYEQRAYAPGEEREIVGWKRSLKTVFSAWCPQSLTAFEIWEGGIRSTQEPNLLVE